MTLSDVQSLITKAYFHQPILLDSFNHSYTHIVWKPVLCFLKWLTIPEYTMYSLKNLQEPNLKCTFCKYPSKAHKPLLEGNIRKSMRGKETHSSSGKHRNYFCCIHQPLVSGTQFMQEEMEADTLSALFPLKCQSKCQACWTASGALNSNTEKFTVKDHLFMILFTYVYNIFYPTITFQEQQCFIAQLCHMTAGYKQNNFLHNVTRLWVL